MILRLFFVIGISNKESYFSKENVVQRFSVFRDWQTLASLICFLQNAMMYKDFFCCLETGKLR